MKIGILTFHASHNYGSMLQAWALQQYLNRIGHDAETINMRIKAQQNLYRFPLRPIKGKLLFFLYTLLHPVWLFHACRKWFRYESFIRNNLQLTNKEYKSWEEVYNDLPQLEYQCIITGGDQIWNMKCKDFSESYYLPAPLSGIRKVSYSPSFGNFLNNITPQQESIVKKYLSDYSYISVRESSMKEYLNRLLAKDITLACDPTLLLKAGDYSSFIDDTPIVKGDYIFYYTPTKRPKYEKLAVKIGKHYGMKVVSSFQYVRNRSEMYTISEAGPIEFLNLLKNAKLVIGKSFHMVVFSLLFHKDFIAFDGATDARLRSIFTILGIPERGNVNEENYKTITLPQIDFDKVDELLECERTNSRYFLDLALSENKQ